jgi:hypothetical protein
MNLERLRKNLPSMLGGPVEKKTIVTGMSNTENPERRAEKVRARLFDNLPQNGRVEAELRMDLGDEELDTEHYSGLEEVEAAYETWMSEYDLDSQVMSADLIKYDDSGEFEIRIQEVENVRTNEWRGAHHADKYHNRSDFSEIGGYEGVRGIETGETVAVLEGEYEREV